MQKNLIKHFSYYQPHCFLAEPSSNFPRNFSSNSVSSSISSVDQANQAPNDSSEEKKMKNLTLEEDCEVDVNKKSDKNGDSMLSSIAEAQNGKTELKTLNPICNDSSFSPLKSLSPKIFRKKKSLNSAPESRQIKASKSAISPLKTNSGKPKLKTFGNYSKLCVCVCVCVCVRARARARDNQRAMFPALICLALNFKNPS